MAYNRAQALKICTAAEMDVFLSSLSDSVGTLTPVQLRSRIARARTLRDKNADLFRRQAAATRVATGTKRGASGEANRRTEQKAQIFAEVLARLEARQSAMDPTPAKKAVVRAAAKPAKIRRAPAAPAQPKKSAAKRMAAKAAKPAKAKPLVAAAPKKAARPAAKKSLKAPAVKAGNPVSQVVKLRGKVIGAHARSSGARVQARRDKR